MGAIEALSWECLPPAGEPVLLDRRDQGAGFLRACFSPYLPTFFGSGTAALAAAVRGVVTQAGRRDPVVLLPAYACPNVVSAVLHAGARPRLVDLAADRPWMDVRVLENSIDEQTIALIAIDFLGLLERYELLAPISRKAGLALIQDSAQAFPRAGEQRWHGDLVVLSFGRGKPISLIGGGAVLYRDTALAELMPRPVASRDSATRFRLQALFYNLLRVPALYRIPASLPMLGLGETRFSPLDCITPAPAYRLRHLQANIEDYWQRNERIQERVGQILHEFGQEAVVDLPAVCCPEKRPRLLRYPVLVKDKMRRDRLYHALQRAGLGVSRMYNTALPRIEGLEQSFPGENHGNADRFASHLLTLPVHSSVTGRHLKRIRDHLSRILTVAA